MATTETTVKKKTQKKAKKNHWDEYMNQYVSVFVPMTDTGSNEPLLIIHNGKAYPFERGKTHRMKRYLAKIYENAMAARQVQYMRVYELQEQTKAALANPSVLA